jgi:trk system potassium uptake protein
MWDWIKALLFGDEGRRALPPRASPSLTDQEFAVIGLGRFGSSLAQTLVRSGHTVLGIDRDSTLVQLWADEITQTLALDSSDEGTLREIGIDAYDTVVVAVGTNFESNIMTTVALKSIGVRNVICKAATSRQQEILLKVGADRVILPEHEAGARLAQELSVPGILGDIRLSAKMRLSELRPSPRMIGKRLESTDLGRHPDAVLLAVLRDESVHTAPGRDFVFARDDLLLVLGDDELIMDLLRP